MLRAVTTQETALAAGLIGGVIGGVFGTFSALISSYWGPRRRDMAIARDLEEREYGPRKELLRRMLSEKERKVRSLDRLKHVTGTSDEECRRLLIEIGARGVLMDGGEREGWALIERFPLDGDYRVTEMP